MRALLEHVAAERPVALLLDAEALGDRIRDGAGEPESVEEVSVLSRTRAGRLPAAARAWDLRWPGELLVLVVLRHLTRSLPKAEANRLRDRIYSAVYEGGAYEWAAA